MLTPEKPSRRSELAAAYKAEAAYKAFAADLDACYAHNRSTLMFVAQSPVHEATKVGWLVRWLRERAASPPPEALGPLLSPSYKRIYEWGRVMEFLMDNGIQLFCNGIAYSVDPDDITPTVDQLRTKYIHDIHDEVK